MAAITVSQFQNLLEKGEQELISPFLKKLLSHNLTLKDKKNFAKFVIAFLEKTVIPNRNEPLFHELIVFLSDLIPDEGYTVAHLYFTYGKLSFKGRYFLYARDQLSKLEKPDGKVFHLWGNTLIALGHYIEEDELFEQAIDKYREASRLGGISLKLLWDWGLAWKELGDLSGEITDFKQAVSCFQKCLPFKPLDASFFVDFGKTLLSLSHLSGDPSFVKEAIELFKISLYRNETSEGWVSFARANAKLFELTGERKDFEEADAIFKEAIAAVPERGELWADWGEIFLRSGWQSREFKELESAVEKLTSMKIQECNPIRVTALLSQSLAALGLVLEDLSLLTEAKKRVISSLEMMPDHPSLQFAIGCSFLAHGFYFNDPKEFEKASRLFKKLIEEDGTNSDLWFALFQTYYGWAFAAKEHTLLHEALEMANRLVTLRPFSSFYWMGYGIALVRLSQFEINPQARLEEGIVKFKKSLSIREDFETLFHYAHALDLYADLMGEKSFFEQALEILRMLYQKLPTDLRIVYQLGLTLSHYGEITSEVEHLKEGIDFFEIVSRRETEDDEVLCQLGYAKLLLSELIDDPALPQSAEDLRNEAEIHLTQAAQLGNGDANYHLACLYSLSKNLDEALDRLQRARTSHSLPSIEEIEYDTWLYHLSSSDAFHTFIQSLREEENG
ncbi:MAG: hypothetical protein S4CHLAM45_10120 [Chlamydiales bacterium]|nr:hypothetical protein [Chlamydiales bacterium]MCH9620172.1 hypothetical protein [Chlamydiales bacterium]MCH9623113.1 hypothetical protein [Chlamydiales bacterium]